MIQTLVSTLVPVYFVLALGYAAGRFGWVDNRATDLLGAFMAKFALPASLFLAVAAAPRELLPRELLPAGIYAATLTLGYALAAIVARRAGFGSITATLFVFTVCMPNFGGIGLGLMQSLRGADAAVSVAVANIVATLTVMLATFVRLEMRRGGHFGRALGAALLKPMTIVPLLGFAVAFAGLPLPELGVEAIRPLALATGGTGLFLTGVILSTTRLRPSRPSLAAVVISNLVQPAAALLLCLALGLNGEVAIRTVVAMAVPCGFVGTILAAIYREGHGESGGALIASSLASAATLPLWIAAAAAFL